jgi:hypothetical protein
LLAEKRRLPVWRKTLSWLNVERIDAKFLRRFDEFNAFVAGRTGVTPSPNIGPQVVGEIAVDIDDTDERLRVF